LCAAGDSAVNYLFATQTTARKVSKAKLWQQH